MAASITTKGKPYTLCNGYEMRLDKISKDGYLQYWRCVKKNCKGRAFSDINSFDLTQKTEHNHIASLTGIKVFLKF